MREIVQPSSPVASDFTHEDQSFSIRGGGNGERMSLNAKRGETDSNMLTRSPSRAERGNSDDGGVGRKGNQLGVSNSGLGDAANDGKAVNGERRDAEVSGNIGHVLPPGDRRVNMVAHADEQHEHSGDMATLEQAVACVADGGKGSDGNDDNADPCGESSDDHRMGHGFRCDASDNDFVN